MALKLDQKRHENTAKHVKFVHKTNPKKVGVTPCPFKNGKKKQKLKYKTYTLVMATRKPRYRYTFEVVFPSQEQKDLFSERVKCVRRELEGRESGTKLDNFKLLSRLLETVEAEAGDVVRGDSQVDRLMNTGAAVLNVAGKWDFVVRE